MRAWVILVFGLASLSLMMWAGLSILDGAEVKEGRPIVPTVAFLMNLAIIFSGFLLVRYFIPKEVESHDPP